MRNIDKEPQPSELISYKKGPGACYDGPEFTPVKKAIKKQLLQEQGYLCAYCMKRIGLDNLKVEHWHCQAIYPQEQLDYGNMLGVCLGNQGLGLRDQTCDTLKAKKNIQYNPANPEHDVERLIRYLGSGEIRSNDELFGPQLNEVLNLNHTRLVRNRKAVLTAVIKKLGKKKGTSKHESDYADIDHVVKELGKEPGNRLRKEISNLLEKWSEFNQGKLPEYSGVAVYFLNKCLKRSGRK